MYKGKKIAVVVPAYNEEKFIAQTIMTIPRFVDQVYVVDDASTDDTYEIASNMASQNGRLAVIKRSKNEGVGAAIISGHKEALEDKMDVVAIMAGDGEMDPAMLDKVLDPVVEGKADYAKGNRFSTPQHKNGMSAWRIFGSFLLTYLTRIASGYWHMSDPQHGYTAISGDTLQKVSLQQLYKSFGFENDMLVKLNVTGARVIDIPMPVPASIRYSKKYSKIRYPRFIVKTSWLLLKDFFWRLWVKYVKRTANKNSIR